MMWRLASHLKVDLSWPMLWCLEPILLKLRTNSRRETLFSWMVCTTPENWLPLAKSCIRCLNCYMDISMARKSISICCRIRLSYSFRQSILMDLPISIDSTLIRAYLSTSGKIGMFCTNKPIASLKCRESTWIVTMSTNLALMTGVALVLHVQKIFAERELSLSLKRELFETSYGNTLV